MTNDQTTAEGEPEGEEPKPIVAAPKGGIVGLAVDIEALKTHFKQFEDLKAALLNDGDYYESKHGRAIGKSGWYKFGVAFNITTVIVHQEKTWIDQPKNLFMYKTKIQGIAPNGRIVEDMGICDNTLGDREGESEHVIMAMSVTRAKERVYITMIGAQEKADGDPEERSENHGTKDKACTCFRDKMALATDGTHCSNCGGKFTAAQVRMLKAS